jgi:MFS family permease
MPLVINELYRFRMLMAGVYVGIAISSTYGFSVFTNHMRQQYGFNQADITTISTVGNCCGYLVFFAGILFDYAGPKVLFPIAGILGFLGFLLFGLAFDGKITSSSKEVALIQFCIFNAILYFGCPAMDAATLMPLMVNFPLERGYMVIIQKTFSGLGTSVLMVYFNGWFANAKVANDSNFSGYAYFVGAQILFCSLLGCYFIDLAPYSPCQYRKRRLSEEQAAERQKVLTIYVSQHAPLRRLWIGCGVVAANLIFLTVNSIATGYAKPQKNGYIASSVVAVVLLACFAIMALPIQALGRYPVIKRVHPDFPGLGYTDDRDDDFAEIDAMAAALTDEASKKLQDSANTPPQLDEREPTALTAAPDAAAGAALHSSPPAAGLESGDDAHSSCNQQEGKDGVMAHVDEGEPAADKVPEPPAKNAVGDPQYTSSFWRNLLTVDLWLFWLSFFGMWGTGTVMNMNAAQMYRSINYGAYEQSRLTLYVALIGVGSAIGRVIGGVLDMYLTLRKSSGKKEILTTTFLPLSAILLFLAYLFFAVIPASGLILPFLLGSIGTGMGWGLGALCVRIVYAKDIGKHYNFMFSSGFVCTIALNRFMFGNMYDNEAKRLKTAPKCDRPSCVRTQMWILMAVNAVSTAAAVIVHIRYSRFVARERAKQAQETMAAEADLANQATPATALSDPASNEEGSEVCQ